MAVTFLDDLAHHGWTLANRNDGGAQNMTWEQFKMLFLGRYFSHAHYSGMVSERERSPRCRGLSPSFHNLSIKGRTTSEGRPGAPAFDPPMPKSVS
ncbi:hypothetical protein ACLB2K_020227 [Fragaria x ananassa]